MKISLKYFLFFVFCLISFSSYADDIESSSLVITKQEEVLLDSYKMHNISIDFTAQSYSLLGANEHSLSYSFMAPNMPYLQLEVGSRKINYKLNAGKMEGQSYYFKGGIGFMATLFKRYSLIPFITIESEKIKKEGYFGKEYRIFNKSMGLLLNYESKMNYDLGVLFEYKMVGNDKMAQPYPNTWRISVPLKYHYNNYLFFSGSIEVYRLHVKGFIKERNTKFEESSVKGGMRIGVGLTI